MALKAKLTKDEHAGLPEAVRALYTEKDGAFILEVEGLVDGKALESERSARAKAAREFQELKDGSTKPSSINLSIKVSKLASAVGVRS